MGTLEKIRAIFPEVNLIKDTDLQDKVLRTWALAVERGGWEPEDIERMPFTLLKPVKINFAQHVRGVTLCCIRVAETFDQVYLGELKMNHDVLIAGALLHDVGKMLEIERKDGKFQKSKAGKFVRHPFSGVALADACGVPEEIQHIIGNHSHEGDHNKRTPEAIILNHADFMNFDPLEG